MRKKIAIIGLKGLPALGGTATVGENLIEQLKYEYDFVVYAISSHTDKSGFNEGFFQIVFKKFPIKKLNVLYYYVISAFHALIKGDYDFIHLHLIDGAFVLPILRLRFKVISTSHGRPQNVEKWNILVKLFFSVNERIFLKFSNIVTSVSLPLIDFYKELTDKEIIYIPNGIKLFDIKPLEQSKEEERNAYLLFAAGRIIPLKGCHLFLKALQRIGYNEKVLIIGDVDQMPQYKMELLRLAQNLNVSFTGLLKDKMLLMNYLENAKLFVFPSYFEAMSIMLLEVVAMKTPVICSDIPENLAIFSDDEVVFFRSNNAEDLAEKIIWALKNEDEMKTKALKAYSRLKSEYRWERIARKYDKLYQAI